MYTVYNDFIDTRMKLNLVVDFTVEDDLDAAGFNERTITLDKVMVGTLEVDILSGLTPNEIKALEQECRESME